MSKVCPITPGEFARLLRKLCHNGRFPERMGTGPISFSQSVLLISKSTGLAVSGGVDSMALSILVRGLVAKTHIQTGVVAFIVDHRARDNSSTEAAAVREMMEKFGLYPSSLLYEV